MGESTRETSQGLKGGNSDMPQAPGQIHLGETIVFCELPAGRSATQDDLEGVGILGKSLPGKQE